MMLALRGALWIGLVVVIVVLFAQGKPEAAALAGVGGLLLLGAEFVVRSLRPGGD
jgi:hypothetical protein